MNKLLTAIAICLSLSSYSQTDTVLIDGLPYSVTYHVKNGYATMPVVELHNTLWLLNSLSRNVDAYRVLFPRLETDIALADSIIANWEEINCMQEERITNLKEGLDALNLTLDECQRTAGRAIDEAEKRKRMQLPIIVASVASGVVVGILLGVLVAGGE